MSLSGTFTAYVHTAPRNPLKFDCIAQDPDMKAKKAVYRMENDRAAIKKWLQKIIANSMIAYNKDIQLGVV